MVNLSHDFGSDLMPAGKSGSGDVTDVAALVQVMTSFDVIVAHDGQGASRVASAVEVHMHQSDFHVI